MASAMLNDQRPGDRHLGAIAKALGDESLLTWLFDGSNPPPWAQDDGTDQPPPAWTLGNESAYRTFSAIAGSISVDLPERRSAWPIDRVLPLILAIDERLQNPALTPAEFRTLDDCLFLFAEGLMAANRIAPETNGAMGKELTAAMKAAAVALAIKWRSKQVEILAQDEKTRRDIRAEQAIARDVDQAAERHGLTPPRVGLRGDLPE